MSIYTENALDFAPGIIFNEFDGGGMIIDRNTGEYVEADQVLKDPLHIQQLDCLDEGHLGCLKLGLCDNDSVCVDDNEPEDEEPVDDDTPIARFLNEQEELTALIAEHEADMAASHTTRPRRRHSEFDAMKDNDKLLLHDRNTAYKNKRRQQTIW